MFAVCRYPEFLNSDMLNDVKLAKELLCVLIVRQQLQNSIHENIVR